MKNTGIKEQITDVLCELAGNFLIAFATYNIATPAGFAISGFSGIAVILFRLFSVPMGTSIFLMNLPFALICAKILGVKFLAKTIRCIIIQSLMMNYVVTLLPTISIEPLLGAILVGVSYGISYAFIYKRGSSTGGVDFILMILKHKFQHIQTGTISFVLEFLTLIISGIVFRDLESVIYGIMIVFLSTTTIDKLFLGFNSGAVAYIVVDKGRGLELCKKIDEVCDRGATILDGRGGHEGSPKDVISAFYSHQDLSCPGPQFWTLFSLPRGVRSSSTPGFPVRRQARNRPSCLWG